uniref:Uncharacterized protein n=1 Tax=Timema poppense TaxID=170557 RepID=A0A7R9CM19_TIMPO|nr:unnamed protein product [Timema poppensis]
MATTCSEGLPISPTENKSVTESVISSGSKSVSRSPSISSFNTKEDRWPSLVVSKEPKRYSRRPPADQNYFDVCFPTMHLYQKPKSKGTKSAWAEAYGSSYENWSVVDTGNSVTLLPIPESQHAHSSSVHCTANPLGEKKAVCCE